MALRAGDTTNRCRLSAAPLVLRRTHRSMRSKYRGHGPRGAQSGVDADAVRQWQDDQGRREPRGAPEGDGAVAQELVADFGVLLTALLLVSFELLQFVLRLNRRIIIAAIDLVGVGCAASESLGRRDVL